MEETALKRNRDKEELPCGSYLRKKPWADPRLKGLTKLSVVAIG